MADGVCRRAHVEARKRGDSTPNSREPVGFQLNYNSESDPSCNRPSVQRCKGEAAVTSGTWSPRGPRLCWRKGGVIQPVRESGVPGSGRTPADPTALRFQGTSDAGSGGGRERAVRFVATQSCPATTNRALCENPSPCVRTPPTGRQE